MIRWLTALAVVAAVCATARADEDLAAKLKEKLSKPFVTKAAWVLDYAEAKKQAKESGKSIFAYFSRSFAP